MTEGEKRLIFESKNTRDLVTNVSNSIYRMTCEIFEGLEHAGIICGNGHHDAQRFALLAAYLIEKKTFFSRDEKAISEAYQHFMGHMI